MKKVTLTFFLTFACALAFAQHDITSFIDLPETIPTIVLNEHVHAQQGTNLKVYDGSVLTDYPTPLSGGLRMQFIKNMIAYRDALYMPMTNGTTHFIGHFTGGGFTTFALPGTLSTDLISFNGRLYFLMRTAAVVKLYNYDGTTLREVPSSTMTDTRGFTIKAGGSFLFIEGVSYPYAGANYLKQYNGVSFSTIGIPSYRGHLDSVFPIGSTSSVYFTTESTVFHYNGTTLTTVYTTGTDGMYLSGKCMLGNDLYFRTGIGESYPEQMFKVSGTTVTEIIAPPGTNFYHSSYELQVFRDEIYAGLKSSSTYWIYKYDGTTWTPVFNWGSSGRSLAIDQRPGSLVFYDRLNGNRAVQYNGSSFEEFFAPEPLEWFVKQLGSTSCFHTWLMGYVDRIKAEYHWVLAKEVFSSTCVPSTSTSVIPSRMLDYDRISISDYGHERDWCWTDIEIDWEIIPVCTTPPCPIPAVQATLRNSAGAIAWQKSLTKPSILSFNLEDKEPYSLSVGNTKDKVYQDFLLFDKDLVSKGFEEITIDAYPKDDYFFLKAKTDKGMSVPFTITLKDTKNKTLWQKSFTAPLDVTVREYVPVGGSYLQISTEQSLKSAVTYYPNPAQGKLNISIAENSGVAHISVSDMNGQVFTKETYNQSGNYTLDLSNQKAGLYILSIMEENGARKELIQIK